ncbi:MAG: T9SS type A sorting domain-containing protein [Ignavibacteriales bacterium]|nr:MAG: T9SS type A sorting domain-containing protein [Ignavibacteriales bacterium]
MGVWRSIGFVNGNGTTTEPHSYTFIDENLNEGLYQYRLKQIDFDGTYKYYELNETVEINSPNKFELSQNFPNPFNPSTKIKYTVPQTTRPLPGGESVYPPLAGGGLVTIKVFDVLGNEVTTLVNEYKPAGSYEVEFNAATLASGVYYYQLKVGNFIETKKMILLK